MIAGNHITLVPLSSGHTGEKYDQRPVASGLLASAMAAAVFVKAHKRATLFSADRDGDSCCAIGGLYESC